MGRPRDEHYWDHVKKEENGTLKCKNCGKRFKGGVARIKAHLGKEKGKGITLCNPNSVPVKEGVNNNIMDGSSNPSEAVNGMNSLEVAGGAHEMVYTHIDGSYTGPINMSQGLANIDDVVGSDYSGFESETSKIKELIDMLTREKGNIERELQWVESRTGQERKRDLQIDDWLARTEDLKGRAHVMIESLRKGCLTGHSALEVEIKELIEDVQTHTEGKPLVLSNELVVGWSFHKKVEKLLKLVQDDKVLIIGIHGMGGVGKTTLVTHFKNRMTRYRDYKHVFWVTVSQDFSIFKLQSGIARQIGVKLDEDGEIIERAKILSSALEKKGKLVLILDDVWNHIDVQKVGIPLRVDGIKLILTSRLEYVFHQMDCPRDSIIQVEPLCPFTKDDWELFLLKLGCYGAPAALSDEVEKIARSIVTKCDGLPLAIGVMARTMKGVDDIHQWRHVLKKFENSAMGEEMEEEIFKALKLSYDYLMDKNIQNCFLHCALYGKVSTNKLIMNLAEEGLIKEMKSLEEIFDEGHVILDKLKSQSLLLTVEYSLLLDIDDSYLSMNGPVRDMACRIVKDRYMVKCSRRLTKTHDTQEWASCLEKISLMDNDIEEIPEGTSPWCPRLSTLIFSHNKFSQMPFCFFKCMSALTMLDLSYNEKLTSLPNSLSGLRTLKSLLLEGCYSLVSVPPLGELHELSRLIISHTSIEQVPAGLATLVKLRWLDLSYNKKLTSVPRSVLSGLTNMLYLDLRSANVTIEVETVQGMSMLEYFAGGFQVGENMNDYVENTLDRGGGPKYYNLSLGMGAGVGESEYLWEDREDRHYVDFGDCGAFDHLLPRDLHRLRVSKNEQWSGGICDALSFKAPSSLRRIHVRECPKLERLFCSSGSCSLCAHLQNLQFLYLYKLKRLDVIWTENDEGMHLPKLSHLSIRGCHSMEKLVTPVSLQRLPSLETIEVCHCNSMKEIFATRSCEDDSVDSTVTLPKSFKLTLWNLPQLKTVCTRIVVSESLPKVIVVDCPNLMPGSLQYKSSPSDFKSVVLL